MRNESTDKFKPPDLAREFQQTPVSTQTGTSGHTHTISAWASPPAENRRSRVW